MCLPRVKKFLCCISLESGGLMIGWFNLIFSCLMLIGLISMLSWDLVEHSHGNRNTGTDNIVGSFFVIIGVYAVFILYYLIVFIASLLLIQGISRRDYSRMFLFLILMATGVILQFLQVLWSFWASISGLFLALLSLYFYICIYSLYDKIRNEKMGRPYV